MTRRRYWAVFVSLAAACALLLAPSANAAFPGRNGKIAFASSRGGNSDIYTMNPDGTDVTQLTTDPGDDSEPAWSPDGTKIAFSTSRDLDPACLQDPNGFCNYEIYVMNADGSNQTRLTHESLPDVAPAWSPDGAKIVYGVVANCSGPAGCNFELYTINADGTNPSYLPNSYPCAQDPAWSPDGTLLAWWASGLNVGPDCPQGGINTVKPDGTGRKFFTSGQDPNWAPDQSAMVFTGQNGVSRRNLDGTGSATLATGSLPAWSPDGTKIVYTGSVSGGGYEIYVMNSNGTSQTRITNDPATDWQPDWQPLPINYYPRPRGATPFQTYLTVAYKPCPIGGNNRQHGAPLAGDSCSPPVQTSDYLTVGTLDSNGQKANSVGSVRYDVKLASPADVKLAVSILDVRNKSDLSDYTGELLETSLRRITDKNSTPAPDGTTEAATVADIPFSATVPCAATSDTTIGSSCALATTANALVPGQVIANMRSIWQLDQVKLYDGGADGQASTTPDNTLFMDEGIFVP